jgi:hypothetical protein
MYTHNTSVTNNTWQVTGFGCFSTIQTMHAQKGIKEKYTNVSLPRIVVLGKRYQHNKV